MLAYGVIFPTYDETALHKTQNVIPTKLVRFLIGPGRQNVTVYVLQEEYTDKDGVIVGLGYDYRESLEFSLKRLFALLDLASGNL